MPKEITTSVDAKDSVPAKEPQVKVEQKKDAAQGGPQEGDIKKDPVPPQEEKWESTQDDGLKKEKNNPGKGEVRSDDHNQEEGTIHEALIPNKEGPEAGGDFDINLPPNDGVTKALAEVKAETLTHVQAEAEAEAEAAAIDRMVEDLVSKSPPDKSKSHNLTKQDGDVDHSEDTVVEANNNARIIDDSKRANSQGNCTQRELFAPNEESKPLLNFYPNSPPEERPEGHLDPNPPLDDGEEDQAEVESAIDKMVEDAFATGEDEIVVGGSHNYKDSVNGSNNGSMSDEGDEVGQDEPSDEASLMRPHYPPPPPGYEHYPPPPGYYPYPPHYPPHPHYGYPPPPPGYYPPPPGYYPPPPGHPHHPLPPPQHPAPPGERDPSTGNFIYGGPPPTAAAPAKRSRMRIKTPEDIMNRKIRKNAQSRSRAARLREKVDTIKVKGDNMKTEEEARLYQTFEERRSRKNNRSRERALEKKAELERITAKPESERTTEEIETLNIAMTAKRRKNEGDRLRRERLKTMGLKVKPPGVSIRGRPRKPLSGEPKMFTYGNPVPFAPVGPPMPPSIPLAGTDTFQYPPQAMPPSYPAMYYNEPPSMKDENDERGEGEINQEIEVRSDDRPGSARSNSTEQEVSDLLLQDDINVDMKEASDPGIEC